MYARSVSSAVDFTGYLPKDKETILNYLKDVVDHINENDELKDKSKDCTQLCCRKMQISAGEKIMITGESGCGKSTLLKLMQGFYPVENEKIKIYGKDRN